MNLEDKATLNFYTALGERMHDQAVHTNAYLTLVKKFIAHNDKTLDIGAGMAEFLSH